jgi:thiamine biosynthesis lipoprotein
MSASPVEGRFRALGTTVELTGVGIDRATMDRALTMAIGFADRWEETFSRFRPGSELSRLNAANGEARVVSADLLWMVERAAEAHTRTRGRFDPTILPGLEAAGYDRDIQLVRTMDRRSVQVEAAPAPGMCDVEIDPDAAVVRLPPGVRIDFGGIAKGAFVDRLAYALMSWPGGCVAAGGDLRVWGESPDGDDWIVGVENPANEEDDLLVVAIHDGRAAGVATSAVNRRRWAVGDGTGHHLIDPATGRPTAGEAIACTVFAVSTTDAEIATKSLFIAAARGEPLAPVDAAAAVMVYRDRSVDVLKGPAGDAVTLFPLDASRRSA